ncbi:hypothetical protein [Gordonia rubripertincta]|uniref:Type IV secretion system protein n=1 Tax=Gordonia rubripertincta TaxID=36822 RepID=A0ABT4N325_GORRU|nr:hypothetical protein [Gordonia rubripertincta]MCZ4553643.1 hypothetical protein [Gordonia rubripertincta]
MTFHNAPRDRGGRSRALWTRVVLLVATVLVLLTVGAGHAAAAPDDDGGMTASSGDVGQGKKLPAGLPAEIKPLIAGTDEFKNGPWFSGACAGKGGDMAGYLAAVFPKEEKMRYWRKTDEEKTKFLSVLGIGAGVGFKDGDGETISPETMRDNDQVAQLVRDKGVVPPENMLGKAFPNDRSEFYPSTTPVCAEDFKRWNGEKITTWGFEWAEQPDAASLQAMTGGDKTKTDRIKEPCKTGERNGWAYCEHAFFVNCDNASRGTDLQRCTAWNVGVGRMFDETAAWIDRNTSLSERIGDTIEDHPLYKGGAAIVKAYSDMWQGAKEVVEFIKDPGDVIGKWANNIKAWSMDLVQQVLPGLADAGDFDFTADYFAEWYAKSVGLGIALLCVLFLAATVRASRNGGARELMYNTVGYLPVAVVMMIFAPGVAYLLEVFFGALADAIVGIIGTSVDELVNNVSSTLGALTNETLVGGTIMGIIGFGLLGLGAFALYLGLLMHQIGIPLASCAMAIGFAFFVYPPWRKKALRIPFTLISIMASVPLLFFLLGIVADIMNSASVNASLGSGDLQSLGQLALMALCFIVIGLAPLSMLKWAPILPDTEDADRMGDGGGGGGQVLGAGMGGAIGASRGASGGGVGGGGGDPVGGQGASMASKATNTAANHHNMPHGGGGGHDTGGGQGGQAGKGIEKGSKGLGKAAALTGPEGGAAGKLLAAAGGVAGKGATFAGHAAYAGASGGTRAAAMNASNRTHGVAADSAPTPDHT